MSINFKEKSSTKPNANFFMKISTQNLKCTLLMQINSEENFRNWSKRSKIKR